ncbi:unnamed protein product [Eruca vesicaria subsp. sativa]|uniref:ATP synthase F0 subunit 8 n=1 Tax=Eruca vesicaria subsp. sativa TaxID=29727 RepID=A0ABC8LTG5_ERUVS|nr:unnamed protein product [Eruca vesicaria subsp. sativa]
MNFLNSAASICRRVSLRELITEFDHLFWFTSLVFFFVFGMFKMVHKRWAAKKTAGSTKNGRDSKPKNLGVKKFGGENVIPEGRVRFEKDGDSFFFGVMKKTMIK